MPPRILYVSRRAWLLRLITVFVVAQAAFAIWLVSLPARAEWPAPFGAESWWVVPAGLVGLSLVLPGAMAWLHGRYVVRIDASGGMLHATLFTWWGTRGQTLSLDRVAGARAWDVGRHGAAPAWRLRLRDENIDWVVDRQGEFPEGEDTFDETVRVGAGR